MQAAHHTEKTFLVPRRDDSPDVGVHAPAYVENIQDEVAEIASLHAPQFSGFKPDNPHELVRFGMAVVAMVERRSAADVEDFARPLLAAAVSSKSELGPEEKRRLVAAELGRILDWICQGQPVLGMGVRAAVVASHIRAKAIDHRTDQQLAREVGNGSRASVNKVKAEFRRDLGANYPGEHGKGSKTKARCKKSRLKNLKG